MNKRKSILLGALLLLISGTTLAFVLPPRISWNPAELNPASIAPGQTASFSVTLTHTGILPIPATNQLRVVADGAIVSFVTITPPTFPPVIKRGNQVKVNINVTVPQGTPLSVVKGNLILSRILPNGKVKEVWRADTLPVELTLSAIPLPPDPGEMGKQTIEGIDSDLNGVRDDIDRFIGFAYPDSEKRRIALTENARLGQKFMMDYVADPSNELQAQANARLKSKAQHCRWYVFGANISSVQGDEAEQLVINDTKTLLKLTTNTKERYDAYFGAEKYLGGMGFPDNPTGDKADCSFDPDSLPN